MIKFGCADEIDSYSLMNQDGWMILNEINKNVKLEFATELVISLIQSPNISQVCHHYFVNKSVGKLGAKFFALIFNEDFNIPIEIYYYIINQKDIC